MRKTIQKLRAQFPKQTQHLPHIVSIPIPEGRCREEWADNLRRWCGQNCEAAWRPVERWTPTMVRIGFESAYDATMFRLAN